MTENKYFGIARCKRCGNGFGLPDEESRLKCIEKEIKCPCCGDRMEVVE